MVIRSGLICMQFSAPTARGLWGKVGMRTKRKLRHLVTYNVDGGKSRDCTWLVFIMWFMLSFPVQVDKNTSKPLKCTVIDPYPDKLAPRSLMTIDF